MEGDDKQREDDPSFSVKKLCKKLVDVDDQLMKCLRTFVKKSKDCSKEDIVLEFLNESTSMYESSPVSNFFLQRRTTDEILVVFNFLEVIFLRISGDLHVHEPWAVTVIKQLLQQGLVPIVKSGLQGVYEKRKVVTLRLLTSMVTSSVVAAANVSNSIVLDLTTFQKLLSVTKHDAGEHVRDCTIHFMTSFLLTENPGLISHIISGQGFALIFMKIQYDKVTTIEILMRTLLSKVVQNPLITKALKVRVFNLFVLTKVLDLFKWIDKSKKKKISAEKRVERRNLVRQLAYEFLETLCCSRDQKTNILLVNHKQSVKTVNPHIIKLLSNHINKYEDPLIGRLFISIFKVIPNKISSCLHKLGGLLEVNSTDSSFVRGVSYVRKIFATVNPINVLKLEQDEMEPMNLAKIMVNVVTTPLLNRNVLTTMLTHKNVVLRHEGVLFMGTVLVKSFHLISMYNTRLKSSLLQPDKLSDFVNAFKKLLKLKLPSLKSLVDCLNLAVSNNDLVENRADDAESLETLVKDSDHVLTIITVMERYARIGDISLKRNIAEVSEGLLRVLAKYKEGDCDTDVAMKILEFISNGDYKKPILSKMVLEKSIALFVCEIICKSSDDSSSSKQLLKTLLLRTGHFDEVQSEVDIWVDYFIEWSTGEKDKTHILQFFVGIILHLVQNVESLIDYQKDLCLKAVGSSSKEEEKYYDKFFDNLLLEDEDVIEVDDSPSDVRNRPVFQKPFSLMVSAALDYTKSIVTQDSITDDCRNNFLSSVLADIIHMQNDFTILCYVLKKHEKILSKRLMKYVRSLDPSDSEEEQEHEKEEEEPKNIASKESKIVDRKGITSHLRQTFQNRSLPSAKFNVSVKVWKQLNDEDVTIIVRQILIYLKVLVRKQSSYELFDFFYVVLKNILTSVWISSELVSIVANRILNHSVTRENFLRRDDFSETKENSSVDKITKLVHVALRYSTDPSAITYIVDCVFDFVVEELRILHENVDITASKYQTSLVHLLDPVKDKLSVVMLRRLVESLCGFTSSEILNESKTALSSVGRLLACVLMAVTCKQLEEKQQILTLKQVAAVSKICKDVSELVTEDGEVELSALQSVLLDLLENSSLYGHVLGKSFFEFCLKSSSSVNRKISDVILRSNTFYFGRLENFFLESDVLRKEPQKYAKVVLTFLRFHGTNYMEVSVRKEKTDEILSTVVECYWPLIIGKLLKNEYVDVKDGDLDIPTARNVVKILLYFKPAPLLRTEQKIEFCLKAEEHFKSGGIVSSTLLELLRVVICSMSKEECDSTERNLLELYLIISLKCLRKLFPKDEDEDEKLKPRQQKRKQEIRNRAEKKRSKNVGIICFNATKILEENKNLWSLERFQLSKKFLKLATTEYMKSIKYFNLMKLIVNLLAALRKTGELKMSHVNLVFETMYQHENFIKCLMDTTSKMTTRWKSILVDLLLFLVKVDPTLCKSEHIPIYLASYKPVLSEFHDKIFQLLCRYELNGISIQQFHPIVWGKNAVNVYSICDKEKPASTSKLDFVELLNSNTMVKTVNNFPLTLNLNENDGSKATKLEKLDKNIYDPRFLLPWIGNILSTTSKTEVEKFIKSNCLSLAFASLSSLDVNMRAAGYFILNKFYQCLKNVLVSNRAIWIYLLDLVRNAITVPCQRLSSVIAIFLAKICNHIRNSTRAVSVPLINFIFAKPILDIHNVPDFYYMFNNPNSNQRICRMWILDLLESGLRTTQDIQLCNGRHVLKIIFGYYNSQLASKDCKLKILNVLKSVTKIRKISIHLYGQYGIMTFLDNVVRNCVNDGETIYKVVEILYSFWHHDVNVPLATLEQQQQPEILYCRKDVKDISNLLLSEFQLVMMSLLDHWSDFSSIETFKMYITTLFLVVSFGNEERFSVPKITSLSLKKIFKIYAKVVGHRFQNHNKDDAKDYTDFNTIIRCKEALYGIVTNWRCHSKQIVIDVHNVFPDVDVFIEAVKLLLQIIEPCLKSHGKLIRVFDWLREHLDNDATGSVTLSLLHSSDCKKEIIQPLLDICEYLLKAMTSGSGSLISGQNPVNPLIVLARLDRVFVAIGQNLRKGDLRNLKSSFSWEMFRNLVQRPDVCELIDAVEGNDGPLKNISAVSLAFLFCEPLVVNNDSNFSQSFSQNVITEAKTFAENNVVTTKTDRKSEKRKKNRTDEKTSKKARKSE